MRKLIWTLLSLLAFASPVYSQNSGTPSTLRVKIDANGYLLAAGVAQTNPVTTSLFGNARLKTDANGNLLVVVSGGTITGSVVINGSLTVDSPTLFVDSVNHRVGVGTLTPEGKLEAHSITGNDNLYIVTEQGANAAIWFEDSTITTPNWAFLGRHNSSGLFKINNSSNSSDNHFVINTSGQVGIGAAPSYPLDVVGDVNSSTAFRLPRTTSSTTGILYKNGIAAFHDFKCSGCDGQNLFIGSSDGMAGNFTMSKGGGGSNLASYNLGVGINALSALTTGHDNIAIGLNALANCTTCQNSLAIGEAAARFVVSNQGITAFGVSAAGATTSDYVTAIGFGAVETGTGGRITAIGVNAAFASTSSTCNCTAIGIDSLLGNTTGTENTAIGDHAGTTEVTANQNVSGNQNTWVGTNAGPGSATQLTNSIGVGYESHPTASNQAVFGNSSITRTDLFGAVVCNAALSVSSGFGTGASFATGSNACSFDLNVGTTPGTSGVLTLPTAPNGWTCRVDDITTIADRTYTSAYTTASATLTTTVGWTNNDHIYGSCTPF